MKQNKPHLFSYVVSWDGGLAPNPYWGYCTLAVCKPQVRRNAGEGDWIVGLSPRRLGYHLIYAMKVWGTPSFAEYFEDGRFGLKKPDLGSEDPRLVMGDNFYRFDDSRLVFEQLESAHSHSDGSENLENKGRDLSGERVLVAGNFYYFGSEGPTMPSQLSFLEVGRGHRNNFEPKEIVETIRFLDNFEVGIQGVPRDMERGLRWLREKER